MCEYIQPDNSGFRSIQFDVYVIFNFLVLTQMDNATNNHIHMCTKPNAVYHFEEHFLCFHIVFTFIFISMFTSVGVREVYTGLKNGLNLSVHDSNYI